MDNQTDFIHKSLTRHYLALNDCFAEFYGCNHFFEELFKRCGDAPEMWAIFRRTHELIEEVGRDLEGLGLVEFNNAAAHPESEPEPAKEEQVAQLSLIEKVA